MRLLYVCEFILWPILCFFVKSNMIVDNFLNLGVNSFDKFNDRLIQEPLGAKVPTKIISLK